MPIDRAMGVVELKDEGEILNYHTSKHVDENVLRGLEICEQDGNRSSDATYHAKQVPGYEEKVGPSDASTVTV